MSYEVGSTWSPRLQGSSWTWSHQSVGLTRPAGQPPSQKDQGRRWWHLQSHTNSNPNLGNQSECLCKGSSAIKSPWSCDQEAKSGGAQPKIRLQDACPGQHLVSSSLRCCHLKSSPTTVTLWWLSLGANRGSVSSSRDVWQCTSQTHFCKVMMMIMMTMMVMTMMTMMTYNWNDDVMWWWWW